VIPAELTEALEASHRTLDLLVRGDPEPRLELFSRAEDVTLANPLGAVVRGFDQVATATRRTVSQMRDGEPIRFEPVSQVVTADLAYVVEIERSRVKLGGADQLVPFSLRSTTVYRREEDGVWRICHRHADPVTTPRPIDTLIDRS
jgi:ketosteroid isomerase-like protein